MQDLVMAPLADGERSGGSPMSAGPARKSLLLVDGDSTVSGSLRAAVRSIALATVCADYSSARARLSRNPPDWLVTNLRLGIYNGLQLVRLVATADLRTRSLVYTDHIHQDVALVSEAQAAGAFYETQDRLVQALPGYLAAVLPAHDQRSPVVRDRRSGCRGGRRASDVPATRL
jgi:DNA-binding NtrC family response regulator